MAFSSAPTPRLHPIHVKDTIYEKSFSVHVNLLKDSMATLAQRIFEREGILPAKQGLYLAGVRLHKDSKLKANDTVYLNRMPCTCPRCVASEASPSAQPAAPAVASPLPQQPSPIAVTAFAQAPSDDFISIQRFDSAIDPQLDKVRTSVLQKITGSEFVVLRPHPQRLQQWEKDLPSAKQAPNEWPLPSQAFCLSENRMITIGLCDSSYANADNATYFPYGIGGELMAQFSSRVAQDDIRFLSMRDLASYSYTQGLTVRQSVENSGVFFTDLVITPQHLHWPTYRAFTPTEFYDKTEQSFRFGFLFTHLGMHADSKHCFGNPKFPDRDQFTVATATQNYPLLLLSVRLLTAAQRLTIVKNSNTLQNAQALARQFQEDKTYGISDVPGYALPISPVTLSVPATPAATPVMTAAAPATASSSSKKDVKQLAKFSAAPSTPTNSGPGPVGAAHHQAGFFSSTAYFNSITTTQKLMDFFRTSLELSEQDVGPDGYAVENLLVQLVGGKTVQHGEFRGENNEKVNFYIENENTDKPKKVVFLLLISEEEWNVELYSKYKTAMSATVSHPVIVTQNGKFYLQTIKFDMNIFFQNIPPKLKTLKSQTASLSPANRPHQN